LQGQAKVAADKTAAATAGQDQSAAGQTMYAQVKANIDKLDKKGKQRILQLLQKSMAAPAAPAAPAAGAGAMGAMAQQLGAAKPAAEPANTMANAPVSKTNVAKPGNPNAAPAADPAVAPAVDPAAAPAQQTAPKKRAPKKQAAPAPAAPPAAEPKKRAPKKQAAPAQTQAEIDADRERIMGVTSDSIVRRQPMMAESFSLFRKRT
jgi:hypothetical protein